MPEIGETRRVSGFLWFPKELKNPDTGCMERRWLERATWIQEFIRSHDGHAPIACWSDVEWLAESEIPFCTLREESS